MNFVVPICCVLVVYYNCFIDKQEDALIFGDQSYSVIDFVSEIVESHIPSCCPTQGDRLKSNSRYPSNEMAALGLGCF